VFDLIKPKKFSDNEETKEQQYYDT